MPPQHTWGVSSEQKLLIMHAKTHPIAPGDLTFQVYNTMTNQTEVQDQAEYGGRSSCAPGNRVIEDEVPDCGDTGAEQVCDQIVHRKRVVQPGQDRPIDDQAADIDRDV